jgi:hypothetical protein
LWWQERLREYSQIKPNRDQTFCEDREKEIEVPDAKMIVMYPPPTDVGKFENVHHNKHVSAIPA